MVAGAFRASVVLAAALAHVHGLIQDSRSVDIGDPGQTTDPFKAKDWALAVRSALLALSTALDGYREAMWLTTINTINSFSVF